MIAPLPFAEARDLFRGRSDPVGGAEAAGVEAADGVDEVEVCAFGVGVDLDAVEEDVEGLAFDAAFCWA